MTAWVALGSSLEAFLEEAGQGREHQGALEALFVHQLESGGGFAERGR